MTTRRDVLKIGALGSLTVAGAGLADVSRASETLPPAPASTLAPANTPVPYAGVFRRPPELAPYETGFDDGDPARPFARYALTQKLGTGPARARPVDHGGGLQRHLPRADHPGQPGHPHRGADPQRPPRRPGILQPGSLQDGTHLHGSAVAAPVRRLRQRLHRPRRRQELPVPELADRPARSGTTTTSTTSPPRTCTRAWRRSTRSPTRSSAPSCRRASTTCR